MEDRIRAAIVQLEREHPAWQVWVVPVVVGPDAWCARPWGSEDAAQVINENSPEDLGRALAEEDQHWHEEGS